jgi:hypothetical protein
LKKSFATGLQDCRLRHPEKDGSISIDAVIFVFGRPEPRTLIALIET